jgi:pyruvate,water dikinase
MDSSKSGEASTSLVPLGESAGKASVVGGKAANLGTLISAGIAVPQGVVVPTEAYLRFLRDSSLQQRITTLLEKVDYSDERSLNECSRTIRGMITGVELNPGLSTSIEVALEELDKDATWAVRSSAIAEDLAESSFAGQQDTFLGIRAGDVPDHVRKCWASYWNARAIKYRHDAGFRRDAEGMAVLIQKMVDASVSGILFTTDPLTGDKKKMIVESTRGLGEAVASGQVIPDRFTISKDTIEVVDRRLSESLEPTRTGASLNDGTLRSLGELGLRIERLFGAPQDIEWAVEDDVIFILQSRPITTLGSDSQTLWTRAYGDEYWADVTSPLFYSLLGDYLTQYVNHEGSRILGYTGIVGKELLRVHKGHVYFNTDVLEEVFSYNPRFSRTKELLNYFPVKDQQRIANIPTRMLRRIWSEVRVMFIDPDGMMIRTDKAYNAWADRFLKEMRRFDELDLGRLSTEELESEFWDMERAYLKHYRLIRYGMVTHSIGTNLIVKRWLTDWLGDSNGVLYSRLMSGLPDNKTIKTNIALAKLAKLAREDDSVLEALHSESSHEFLARLKTDKNLNEFGKELGSFLSEYGHRSHTREIYFPRWVDDPSLVIDVVKALVSSERLYLEELEKAKEEDRIRAEEEVLFRISRQKLGFVRKRVFKIVLRFAQTYLMFRENQRFYLDHQIMRQRRLFMEYSRRFVASGALQKPDDIFFLSKEEVFGIAGGRAKVDRETIAMRRKEFEDYRSILPPKFVQGDREFDDTVVKLDGSLRITGTSASPGTFTGKVRVVDSIEHLALVQQNEILVTTNTDPGWTAVFSKLGGLVTETGGMLSHGAVVSREYGIPAVTAVTGATSLLKTGQIVTLDGGEGVVYIERGVRAKDSDIIHEFGDHIDWNESYYFNFYDQRNAICGFMRIGLKPNRNEKSMFCFFMMPDGEVIGGREQESFRNAELRVRGLRYEKVVPERTWRLLFTGTMLKSSGRESVASEVFFNLEFEGMNKIFDYRESVPPEKVQMSRVAAAEHMEQFGRITGKLVIDGREYAIEGLGERDHSWGVRDWIAPTMWVWLTAQFGEDCAFNLTKLLVNEGEVDAGFIHIDGENKAIVRAEIQTDFEPDGAPRFLKLVLHDKGGEEHLISGSVIMGTRLPFAGPDGRSLAVMHETLSRYEYRGMTGYGIAEYLTRMKE